MPKPLVMTDAYKSGQIFIPNQWANLRLAIINNIPHNAMRKNSTIVVVSHILHSPYIAYGMKMRDVKTPGTYPLNSIACPRWTNRCSENAKNSADHICVEYVPPVST